MLKTAYQLIGLSIWCALAAGAAGLLTERRQSDRGTLAELRDYFGSESLELTVELPRAYFIELGDAVFIAGREKQVGEVAALVDAAGEPLPRFYGQTSRVRLRFYDRASIRVHADASARLILVPDAFVWVLETLFTEENVPRIAAEWNATMLRHRDEIFRLLTPIARDLIHDVERTVAESLDGFIARHQPELRSLAEGLQDDFDDGTIADIFQKDIWPLAEARFEPVAAAIGREIWAKVPLWSFSWRIVYQSLPLTSDDHFRRAWSRFVEREIKPIILAHLDELIAASRHVGRDALRSARIKAQMRTTFLHLTSHPRFHALAQVFIQEIFLDNPRFHDRMFTRLKSPEVERALAAASAHVEPSLRRIADIVFGTREEGITREFARVLRAQILQKDRRRFVVDPGTAASAPPGPRGVLPTSVEWEKGRSGDG